MRNLATCLMATMLMVLLVTGSAFALNFGTNITIYDQNSNAATGWAGEQEDQEVEPGMETGQQWDLEAFFLSGTTLTMVGGYDFQNGEASNNDTGDNDGSLPKVFESGDIFIDVNGDAVYGDIHGTGVNGNLTVNDNFGYDYVLDMDFSSLTYNVYALTEDSTTMLTSYYLQNYGSNPWRYVGGGELIGSGQIGYQTGLTDAQVGLAGGLHNAVSVNLDFLSEPELGNMISHFTMECGNDNLMGMGQTPEPATMLLLGSGLVGLAGLRRKYRKS